jgi:asparagine synthetase B (glutamine-hydrolysing)
LLKDRCDERIKSFRYRHAADKLQKTENVMEKYKKKLQEGADLRSQLRVSNCSSLRGGVDSRPVSLLKSKMQTLWTKMLHWRRNIEKSLHLGH